MRSVLAGIALVILLGATAGCTSSPATPTAASPGTTKPLDPEIAQACADARAIIMDATGRFSAAMARAVAAGEAGDLPTRDAAMAEVRTAFKDWSADLRATVEKVTDPQLEATLLAYAGAVDATIARVKTFADLDTLYTFDEQELDIMASQFADVCP